MTAGQSIVIDSEGSWVLVEFAGPHNTEGTAQANQCDLRQIKIAAECIVELLQSEQAAAAMKAQLGGLVLPGGGR